MGGAKRLLGAFSKNFGLPKFICNICLQICLDAASIHNSSDVFSNETLLLAASEAARKSKSGKGKLDESQGRKASGLHDKVICQRGCHRKVR